MTVGPPSPDDPAAAAPGSVLGTRPVLARVVVLGVLLVGIVMLQLSFASPPASTRFYVLSLALAGIWLLGGLLVRPLGLLPEPRQGLARAVGAPILVGLGLAVIFVVGAVVVDRVPVLDRVLAGVFDYADRGRPALILLITVINGVGEEFFFRGALWRLVRPPYRYAATTLIYALVTIATGNPLLVFAAVLLALVVGRLRQVTGGVLAPALAHIAWSVTMLLAVPALTT